MIGITKLAVYILMTSMLFFPYEGTGANMTTPSWRNLAEPGIIQSYKIPPRELITPEVYIDEHTVELLAIVIYQEAGGDSCCDECRKRVADVVLNRVTDDRFPSTIEDVLLQDGQYGTLCSTGIQWPERANYDTECNAVQRAYKIAFDVYQGNHSDLFGNDYIFQAGFPQGTECIYCDNCEMYYGK